MRRGSDACGESRTVGSSDFNAGSVGGLRYSRLLNIAKLSCPSSLETMASRKTSEGQADTSKNRKGFKDKCHSAVIPVADTDFAMNGNTSCVNNFKKNTEKGIIQTENTEEWALPCNDSTSGDGITKFDTSWTEKLVDTFEVDICSELPQNSSVWVAVRVRPSLHATSPESISVSPLNLRTIQLRKPPCFSTAAAAAAAAAANTGNGYNSASVSTMAVGSSSNIYLSSQKGWLQEFYFDRVFGAEATQEEVYVHSTRALIPRVAAGINATVFAYGATGAGKTFTMLGTDAQPGIIRRSVCDLFAVLKWQEKRCRKDVNGEKQNVQTVEKPEGAPSDTVLEGSRSPNHSHKSNSVKCSVSCCCWRCCILQQTDVAVSYMEVYNEKIRDLLDPSRANLDVQEDVSGVRVPSLSVHPVVDQKEVLHLLTVGNRTRNTAVTAANQTSSRSHAIFQVRVTTQWLDLRSGKFITKDAALSLIDLAGSERASATLNRGERLKEGCCINQSLLALANCINALHLRNQGAQASGQRGASGSEKIFVNYRNSKLTHLLKNSLEGLCLVVMIANVHPAAFAFAESSNTLKYANRAKNLKVAMRLLKGSSVKEEEGKAKLIILVHEQHQILQNQKQQIQKLLSAEGQRQREMEALLSTIEKQERVIAQQFQQIQELKKERQLYLSGVRSDGKIEHESSVDSEKSIIESQDCRSEATQASDFVFEDTALVKGQGNAGKDSMSIFTLRRTRVTDTDTVADSDTVVEDWKGKSFMMSSSPCATTCTRYAKREEMGNSELGILQVAVPYTAPEIGLSGVSSATTVKDDAQMDADEQDMCTHLEDSATFSQMNTALSPLRRSRRLAEGSIVSRGCRCGGDSFPVKKSHNPKGLSSGFEEPFVGAEKPSASADSACEENRMDSEQARPAFDTHTWRSSDTGICDRQSCSNAKKRLSGMSETKSNDSAEITQVSCTSTEYIERSAFENILPAVESRSTALAQLDATVRPRRKKRRMASPHCGQVIEFVDEFVCAPECSSFPMEHDRGCMFDASTLESTSCIKPTMIEEKGQEKKVNDNSEMLCSVSIGHPNDNQFRSNGENNTPFFTPVEVESLKMEEGVSTLLLSSGGSAVLREVGRCLLHSSNENKLVDSLTEEVHSSDRVLTVSAVTKRDSFGVEIEVNSSCLSKDYREYSVDQIARIARNSCTQTLLPPQSQTAPKITVDTAESSEEYGAQINSGVTNTSEPNDCSRTAVCRGEENISSVVRDFKGRISVCVQEKGRIFIGETDLRNSTRDLDPGKKKKNVQTGSLRIRAAGINRVCKSIDCIENKGRSYSSSSLYSSSSSIPAASCSSLPERPSRDSATKACRSRVSYLPRVALLHNGHRKSGVSCKKQSTIL